MKSSTRPRRIFQCISTLLIAGLFLWLGQAAQAMMPPERTPTTAITVNTTTDELNSDGDCSLREAVVAANTNVAVDACGAGSGADTILIPTGVYTLTIEGGGENNAATGDLDIREAVTISGDGLRETIVVGNLSSTGFFDHIFHVVSVATGQVTFRTLGIQRNSTEGILSESGTTVRLEEVALEMNAPGMRSLGSLEVISSTFGANFLFSFTGNGAGLETNGPTTIKNTLFVGNLLFTLDNNSLNGAGWAHLSGAPATINNSTFVSNGWIYGVAPDPGYGTGAAIYATAPVTATNITFGGHNSVPLQNIPELVAGPVRLRNTITNLSSEVPNGCSDEVVSLGFNISTGTDCTMFTQEGDELGVPSAAMNLQPLADNGGPSFTIALGVGSVVRDSGPSFDCPATDQRGVLRPQDGDGDGTGQCDRGAFEAGDGDPEPTGTPTPTGTNTPTVSPTASQTPSPTATGTPTLSPTATNTPTVSPTASQTALPTATETPTPTPTGTIQPTYTPLPTYTPYPTPSGERSLYLPFIYGVEK